MSIVKENVQDILLQRKYGALKRLDCSCFFEYDRVCDTICFSDNLVIPELSGKCFNDITNTIDSILAKEDVERFISYLRDGLEDPITFQICGKDGTTLWCKAKGTALRDENNEVSSMVGYITNIKDETGEAQNTSQEGKLDQLTRVMTRDAMKDCIHSFLENQSEYKNYAMVLLDLDDFVKIDRKLGSIFAEVVLKNIATMLKGVLNSGEWIGRIGGDEFLLFLEGESSDEILKNRIQKIVANVAKMYIGEKLDSKITCSIGVAKFPQHGVTYDDLFMAADKALFQAKRMGKAHLVMYDDRKVQMLPELKDGQEFYNNYNTRELKGYRKSEIDMELAGFALNIMANTKDVKSAINLLIEKMGKTFSISNIAVIEDEHSKREVSSYYTWNKESHLMKTDYFEHYGESFIDYINEKAKRKGREVICISNIEQIVKAFDISEQITKRNVKSVMLCGFYDGDKLKGILYMDDTARMREWTKREQDSFVFITKIIAFYLLKLRNSERISEKMQMIKNYDGLTGLPTLHKFKKDAKILVQNCQDKKLAMAYFDIDNFKYVNDSLGYRKGDSLLREVAQYILNKSVGVELCARTSADNFITLIPFDDDENLKEMIIKNVEDFLADQKSKNITYNIGISIGVYVLKKNETDIMGAIDNANIARKKVKNSTMSFCKFYDEEMENEIRKERMIVSNMESALVSNEFKVFLQPKIDLVSNQIVGAEALVRWKRPDGTMLPPNDFIPLFEKNGFILRLDFFMYDQVCKLLKKWKDNGQRIVPISVNVSRVHLYQDDFIEKVLRLVKSYNIEPSMIEFELTESIFLNNTVTAINMMKELRNNGFCVSIDDFGAGYSSLNLLKDMRTDVLKLDKEFFREGEMQQEERIIVSSIISMAKQLNMKVLSEGVETEMQSDFLKAVECDMAQGYLYAKPLPIENFEQMLFQY